MKNKFWKKYQCYLSLFSPVYHFLDKLSFLSRLWISAKTLFFVWKLNESCRSWPLMKCLIFFVLGWSSNFLTALNTGSVMSELAILLSRVSSISTFCTILLKCLLKIPASSSLLLIILLLLLKIMDSLWKAYSEKRRPTVFQSFLLSETTLWFIFPKKRLLVLRSNLTQKFLWQLKRLLDFAFLVFKNLLF